MSARQRDEMVHISAFTDAPRPQRTADPNAGGIMTKHGWFSYEELAAVQARTVTVEGQRVVQFPIRYEDGQPVYAPIGPEHAKTRQEMAEADAARSRARHEGRSRNG
jgi:hypothetical protein